MSNKANETLADLIQPESRFARSTNIEFDHRDPETTPDYKFTSKTLGLLEDVLDIREGIRQDRAWSIVGPYGSGKSIFCLLLMQLLSRSNSDWLRRSLVQLQLTSPRLADRVESEILSGTASYVPVIVQGSRTSLDHALTDALLRAATDDAMGPSWASEKFLQALDLHLESIDAGLSDSRTTAELFDQATRLVKLAGSGGLIVIIDEFGKFLERAAWQGDISELVTCQYLAELASGNSEPDLLFSVILHQGFADYASALSDQQSREWAKVQGRFRAIGFTQDADSLYDLVSASLTRRDSGDLRGQQIHAWASNKWEQIEGLPAFETAVQRDIWPKLLPQVFPFHPITLYALPRLSSRLSQNERTMFTFLGSDEPVGLKAFLRTTELDKGKLPSITVDYLYEYFVSNAPFVSLAHDAQKSLSEVEVALERVAMGGGLETRVVKAVGTLSLLRSGAALPVSMETIAAALDLSTKAEIRQLKKTLKELLARKVLVFRKFSGEYKLWQGSDFDFDGAIAGAREQIREDFDVPRALQEHLNPRPIVARRHSFRRGATRTFATAFWSPKYIESAPDRVAEAVQGGTDGLIVYALPTNRDELRSMRTWASLVSDLKVLVGVPKDPVLVNDMALELAALKQVRTSWPELQDDPVALKELAGRIDATEELLRQSLEALVEPSEGANRWYWTGDIQRIRDRRQLQETLSNICDDVYPLAPTVLNELINRQNLSSSVVVAAKKVIEALIKDQGLPGLGFEGNGPEVSIFQGVLGRHRLYSEDQNGSWGLVGPDDDTDKGVRAVWREIEALLKSAVESPVSLQILYDKLGASPYGVRKGMIPLFIWLVLIQHRATVSLYENGTFQTEWSPELFDRFVKAPETFKCRWLVYKDTLGGFLQRLNGCIPRTDEIKTVDGDVPLTGFLQNLYAWYHSLPDYATKTQSLSSETLEIRRLIGSAVDPADLVFESIPSVLNIDGWERASSLQSTQSESTVKAYLLAFQFTLSELEGSYTALLTEMLHVMANSVGCDPHVHDLRDYFEGLSEELIDHIREPVSKAFIVRARDADASEHHWLESLGAALAGQAPRYWMDHHAEEFEDKMALVALAIKDSKKRSFAISAVRGNGENVGTRIAIETPDSTVFEEFVSGGERDQTRDEIVESLLRLLEVGYPEVSRRPKTMALARALEMLASSDSTEREI